MSRTMTTSDHADAWMKHNDAAERLLMQVEGIGAVGSHAANVAALAQAHATLAHTHAYLMVEGLR